MTEETTLQIQGEPEAVAAIEAKIQATFRELCRQMKETLEVAGVESPTELLQRIPKARDLPADLVIEAGRRGFKGMSAVRAALHMRERELSRRRPKTPQSRTTPRPRARRRHTAQRSSRGSPSDDSHLPPPAASDVAPSWLRDFVADEIRDHRVDPLLALDALARPWTAEELAELAPLYSAVAA